jgi:hypothetical protein
MKPLSVGLPRCEKPLRTDDYKRESPASGRIAHARIRKDGQLKEGGISLNARLYSAVVAYGCSFDYREEVATERIALNESDDARLKKIQGSIIHNGSAMNSTISVSLRLRSVLSPSSLLPANAADQIRESNEPCIWFVRRNGPRNSLCKREYHHVRPGFFSKHRLVCGTALALNTPYPGGGGAGDAGQTQIHNPPFKRFVPTMVVEGCFRRIITYRVLSGGSERTSSLSQQIGAQGILFRGLPESRFTCRWKYFV